ncbi:CPA1 family monovalent cation:H+ antiporter [Aquibacillus albus]|uniref:CPA1 family monovalent cation:H+ antiporter n=2 Tax=Aquibacillus albus TaxID=1168171 RepID=A0ABS2MWS9_9BACI|nr:sodium:proton antiporter [Aquibacillus albus]MBM7570358.1 CPA1 family monovalent cation:H+ antiporter [Aquibacillus albus]
MDFHDVFIEILMLLAVSIFVIGFAKLIKIPYSIALVIVGLILGLTEIPFFEASEQFITQSNVFHAIIVSLFLPILLADATLKMPMEHFMEFRRVSLTLAFVGTFFTFLIIGFSTYFLLGLPIPIAFTFAALMSATDPISVISIFKSLGVNKGLSTLMETESLFNDGIAVVLFKIASVYLLTYIEMGLVGLGSGALLFLKFTIGGIIVGAILGYAFSQIIRIYDDYPLEIAFALLLYFGCYFIAEHFHFSGVIAVVIGGLIFGSYGSKVGMTETTKQNINVFMDTITELANSLIFLMVGLEIQNIDMENKWNMIFSGILIVLIARTISVYVSTSLSKKVPSKWKVILNWGGLKGSLSIALALSLPQTFEGRDTLLILTFTVVLFSLIIQGLTIKPIINKLGLSEKNE